MVPTNLTKASSVEETGPVTVDDVLIAIQQKNVGRAKSNFEDVMNQKVNDALEAEKVRIASDVYQDGKQSENPPWEAGDNEVDAQHWEDEEKPLEDEVEDLVNDFEESPEETE